MLYAVNISAVRTLYTVGKSGQYLIIAVSVGGVLLLAIVVLIVVVRKLRQSSKKRKCVEGRAKAQDNEYQDNLPVFRLPRVQMDKAVSDNGSASENLR